MANMHYVQASLDIGQNCFTAKAHRVQRGWVALNSITISNRQAVKSYLKQ